MDVKRLKQLERTLIYKTQVLLGFTYKGYRKQPIIFVLSTGRCGSTSIKEMFNQHPNFLAFHEDIKPLIELSTKLAENPNQKEIIYRQLEQIFKNRIWEGKKGQVIVHSDHRLWNLVGFLSDFFPNAYFIHLIRNPFHSVKSYLQRDWYANLKDAKDFNIFDKHRLYGHKVNDLKTEVWQNYSQIEKCLWYWNYVNSNINQQLKNLDGSQHTYIKLEEFEDALNKRMATKYNIDSEFSFTPVVTNRSKKEIQDINLELEIKETIKKHSDKLFLLYYPEFNLKTQTTKL